MVGSSCTSHRTLTPSTECHRNLVPRGYSQKIGCHGSIPRGIKKTNFRLIIYGRSSTNPANLAKIGQVDVEIIGLKEIFKIDKQNVGQSSTLARPPAPLAALTFN